MDPSPGPPSIPRNNAEAHSTQFFGGCPVDMSPSCPQQLNNALMTAFVLLVCFSLPALSLSEFSPFTQPLASDSTCRGTQTKTVSFTTYSLWVPFSKFMIFSAASPLRQTLFKCFVCTRHGDSKENQTGRQPERPQPHAQQPWTEESKIGAWTQCPRQGPGVPGCDGSPEEGSLNQTGVWEVFSDNLYLS